MIGRTNASSGGGIKGMPEFSYTGTYTLIDDKDGNWRIKFLSSGTLNFSKLGTGDGVVDIFCVGGGGAAGHAVGQGYGSYNAGGGGGYTTTTSSLTMSKDAKYTVIIGDGGAFRSGEYGLGGKASSITGAGVNASANGGYGGQCNSYDYYIGGNGGSGGGAGGQSGIGPGGEDGGNGGPSGHGGTGQGTTTREFGEAGATLYSHGGGNNLATLEDNTGNGGRIAQRGASGIVIIRNHRE